MGGDSVEAESPRKRMKISNDLPDTRPAILTPTPVTKDSPSGKQSRSADRSQAPSGDVQATKEAEVGITEFVGPDLPGFIGILKKR